MIAVQKMSGKVFIRPKTLADKDDARIDEEHANRLRELKIKAVIRLRGMGIFATEESITQIGCEGFHYRVGREVISTFEYFGLRTRKENRRIFHART